MSDNLILYEPVESENGLSCPYPGCNKCVDLSKRTQLEAHIRSHRKRKRKNKKTPSLETENDEVKIEIVEIETNSAVGKRKNMLENDQNQNENIESDSSQGEKIPCPVSSCNKTFDEAMQIWDHLRDHKKSNWERNLKNDTPENRTSESKDNESPLESYIQKHGLTNYASKNNDEECVGFTVKIEEDDPAQFDSTPEQNLSNDTSEKTVQSVDAENEIIAPIDDETHEMKPDIKVEEIDNSTDEREEDWFYIKDEDSIKRMFVCKLCFAEYAYLHQLHRHAFICPYKTKIGHNRITSFVKQYFAPGGPAGTRPKPPKLVLTKGNFYCDLCDQVSLTVLVFSS